MNYIATNQRYLRKLLKVRAVTLALSSLRTNKWDNTLQREGLLFIAQVTNNCKSPDNVRGIISCVVECMSAHHTDLQLQDTNCDILVNVGRTIKKKNVVFLQGR